MTPQEHFAQAEAYADFFDGRWFASFEGGDAIDEDDKLILHAADVHLRLAQALRVDPGIRAGE